MFQFADDIALAVQCSDFSVCEKVLEGDLSLLANYLKNWRLTPNPSKSEVSVFHLNNREANRYLKVLFEDVQVRFNPTPVYLGITLDRTLSFKPHLENLAKKIGSRVSIIRKLGGVH